MKNIFPLFLFFFFCIQEKQRKISASSNNRINSGGSLSLSLSLSVLGQFCNFLTNIFVFIPKVLCQFGRLQGIECLYLIKAMELYRGWGGGEGGGRVEGGLVQLIINKHLVTHSIILIYNVLYNIRGSRFSQIQNRRQLYFLN